MVMEVKHLRREREFEEFPVDSYRLENEFGHAEVSIAGPLAHVHWVESSEKAVNFRAENLAELQSWMQHKGIRYLTAEALDRANLRVLSQLGFKRTGCQRAGEGPLLVMEVN